MSICVCACVCMQVIAYDSELTGRACVECESVCIECTSGRESFVSLWREVHIEKFMLRSSC